MTADANTDELVRSFAGNLRKFVGARVRESELDDVLQEVYLRMQRAISGVRDDQRLEAWMFRAARSAIVDQYRARGRTAWQEQLGDELATEQVEHSEESSAERELATCVEPFLMALPSPYREALSLIELKGLGQREAAESLNVSLSAMKSRVQRARTMLRESFERCCHIARDARGRVIDYEPRQHPQARDCCA